MSIAEQINFSTGTEFDMVINVFVVSVIVITAIAVYLKG